MTEYKVSPSILSGDFANMGKSVKDACFWGADLIHVDVMDGVYVPNITFGMPMVAAIKKYSTVPLDVHLMIIEPEKYVGSFVDSGADIVTFHPEASKDVAKGIEIIKSKGAKCGLVLNPDKPLDLVYPYINDIDMVLLMSVFPGFGGQKFIESVLDKAKDLKDYIDFRYNQSLSNVEILDTDSYDTAEKRRISYLTITWFMQTLLDRADRMSMANGFETRVPFCDYRLAQYMYNVPWEMKAYKGREKGILRYIMKDYLPDEIVNRKKSPYPKTHNPTYLKAVKSMLTTIMKDSSSPINYILNRDYILDILNTDGKAFTRPWFGQLMTGPQLMAYLCQVNMWLERYQPKIKL